MALALVLVLVVVGSVLFHALSPWWWTPIASNWDYIDHTLVITFWITGVVFSAVVLFMAYCVWQFRHKEGSKAHYEPESKRLETWLTVVTGIGVAALLAPGLYVWHQFITVPKDATEVEVIAQQWQWSFRLPGADGKLGTSNSRLVSPENPLGINPEDPNGQDDVVVEAADLHLPIGKPVKMLLRSIDVLHDFYVPEFRAKMDMIPGSVTYFWFTPIAHRKLRGALRRALRHRARFHARCRRGRHAGELPGLAAGAVDLCPVVGARTSGRDRRGPAMSIETAA